MKYNIGDIFICGSSGDVYEIIGHDLDRGYKLNFYFKGNGLPDGGNPFYRDDNDMKEDTRVAYGIPPVIPKTWSITA